MTTDITVIPRRSYGFETVSDLTGGEEPTSISPPGESGGVTFTFASDLADETVAAIRQRLESVDDGDQARRAKLRAAAAAGASNLAEMHLAYTLGDPIPDAAPQT